jgi:hypothetical protein
VLSLLLALVKIDIFMSTDAIEVHPTSPNTYAVEEAKFILLIDFMLLGLLMLIWNVAFRPGSSKHGKALRASVGSNCVAASHLKCQNIHACIYK